MPIETESNPIHLEDWFLRVREPKIGLSNGIILMLHGWAGDEQVMWVFARHFPTDQWIVAPRGLFQIPEGGFGWTQEHTGIDADIQEYLPASNRLSDLLILLETRITKKRQPISLVGFSQGTALSYTFGLTNPHTIRAIAGLAGFLPKGAEAYTNANPLRGVPVWIAHGLRDETVPIDRARQAAKILEQAGAETDFCESDASHKLGANCFRILEEFIRKTSVAKDQDQFRSTPSQKGDQSKENPQGS